MSKNPFDRPQPKIHVQTFELGPHHQRIITLPKIEKEKKYTPSIWILASLIVGFSVCATLIQSVENSFRFLKSALMRGDVIAFETPREELLGSDDKIEDGFAEELSGGSYYELNESVNPPRTDALSYLVADLNTGQIILEKNPKMVLPIASVSKLMTAIVAKDSLGNHDEITVTRSSVNTYGTAGGLKSGEKILVTDLMYPLLIESSNDAAEVLADGLGRADFLKKMNAKARELRMTSTSYEDPSGLSARNISTAEDLLLLAQHISAKYSELWDITRVREYAILGHKWQNGNNQLRNASFIGGKNGYTDEALRTSVSVFNVPLYIKDRDEKKKRRVAIIVLKSSDRDGDISRLLRYIEGNIGFEEDIPEPEEAEILPAQ